MLRAVMLACLLLAAPPPARAQDLTVFAAASLTDALHDVAQAWEARGGARLRFNFAASCTLARQMQQGAVANLFASADQQWMDWASQQGLIVNATRRTLLGNDLVLVMPRDRLRPLQLTKGVDLLALLGPGGRLATGDPANVPVGIYARQALMALGLWDAIAPRLAPAEDARSALLLVERGEAPLGIVYSTDAAVAPNVAVAGTFPADTHVPIAYPFAVARAGDTPAARALLDYLAGPEAAVLFRKRGFTTEAR